MNNKDKFYKIIRNPIFIVLCAVIAGGLYYFAYYLRKVAIAPYWQVNGVALFTLILSIVNVFIAYKDTKGSVKELFVENIPGIFFFAAFIAIKFVMRGSV